MTYAQNPENPENASAPCVKRLVLGVDPGYTGALVAYDRLTKAVQNIYDMPRYYVKGSQKPKLDLYQLGMLLNSIASDVEVAFIENVHSMPGQGVVSMFRFGFAAGAVQAAVASAMIPIQLVAPHVWKGDCGLGQDKRQAVTLAAKLFPAWAKKFYIINHHGRAEAALIAHWGTKYMKARSRVSL